MSLKRNILASYASQIYTSVAGIVVVPLYIKYMGEEAYGLVGFFSVLQALFSLLDIGLTPTIGRETARYKGGAMTALAFLQTFRALSMIFAFIALVGGSCLWWFSSLIASRWLNAAELPVNEVTIAVQIMAISVALRWMGGLYRGVIVGSERLVWLSGFNAFVATLRFIVVFATMSFYGFTPAVFFVHQLCVALLEALGLLLMSRYLLPTKKHLGGEAIGWSFVPIRPMLKFALTIAFTSSIWVFMTQSDKFILSGILPLAEYGHFALAVLVASGVVLVGAPISNSIMPNMARLHAEGRHEELISVYRESTQLISVVAGSAAITLATCAEQLVFAWTGDVHLAKEVAPILQLYAIGNGFLAVAAFPYYLQYALGDLRYHLIGNAVIVVLLIPIIIMAATYYGGIGAGYVWLGLNGLYLLTWVAYVHHQLVPGLHSTWFTRDVFVICLPSLFFVFLVSMRQDDFDGRLASLAYVLFVACASMILSVLSSSRMRNKLIKFLRNK
jgi:O-antigen/teichoic acid export membrane protein